MADPSLLSRVEGFLPELKRRKVCQFGALHVLVGYGVAQGRPGSLPSSSSAAWGKIQLTLAHKDGPHPYYGR